MSEKFAIYAGEPMASVLAGYETERSARINAVCAEWRDLINDAVPTLTAPQWLAIIDALGGTMLDDDRTLRHAWADISDAPEICEKWGVDQTQTVAALRAMSWPGLIALRETIRRHWLCVTAGVQDHTEALRQAGACIAESQDAATD